MSPTIKKILYGSLLTGLAVATAGSALAHAEGHQSAELSRAAVAETEDQATTSISPETEAEVEKKVNEIRTRAQERKRQAQAKIVAKKDDARIQRCEERQSRLKEKYSSMKDRASAIIDRIDQRYQRAQDFATKKGLTLANGDALESGVAAKKTEAQTAADAIRDTANGFDCKDDDAKAQADLIRADVEAFKTAVKAYRLSVKNYFGEVIKAFTASLGTEKSTETEASESPTSTVSPTVTTSTTTTASPAGGSAQ